MSVVSDRYFPCVLLGDTSPDEAHPWVIEDVLAVRRNEQFRSLAKRAAHQLRHLTDIAALESFLCRAALLTMKGGNPAMWLEAQVQAIKTEQEMTRTEHARMASRLAGSGQ